MGEQLNVASKLKAVMGKKCNILLGRKELQKEQ